MCAKVVQGQGENNIRISGEREVGRGKRGVGIGMPLVWLNNWEILGLAGKILAL